MSESNIHKLLVGQIYEFILKRYGMPEKLEIDSDFGSTKGTVTRINGHVPDIYAETKLINGTKIIGEAKTSLDIENEHTDKQLKAYMEYCKYEGAQLIIAVPIKNKITIYNKVNKLRKQYDLDMDSIMVLSCLNRYLINE